MRSGLNAMIVNTPYSGRQKLKKRLFDVDIELKRKVNEFIYHPETRDWNTVSGISFLHTQTRKRGKISNFPQYSNGTVMATLKGDSTIRRINVEDIIISETASY
jgi:proline racemase